MRLERHGAMHHLHDAFAQDRASSGSRQIRSTRSSTPEVDTRRAYGAATSPRTPENLGYRRGPCAPIVKP